ncbi:MAG: glycosyltransferase family 39 protein [Bacteroidota bacterium]|nr:glycosyltransferase family 39 protein [Bacteroidota bacterium]
MKSLLEVLQKYAIEFSIAAVVLLLHFYNNAFTTYGMFRDELYYIACSNHLTWGYVDQPPLCAFILLISRTIFGESIFAIRLLPSFANAGSIFLAGVMTRMLGGGTLARTFVCIACAFAPGIIGISGIYSMNAFDILLWQVALYLFIRLITTQQPKYWYWIGFIVGIGLLNKTSMVWLATGIGVATLFTDQRRWLKSKYPWIAAATAFIIFLPYVMWNIQNNLAHLEFMRNASGIKYASQNQITFLTDLVMNNNPIALPLWLAGFWLLFKKGQKEFRAVGIAIATVLLILLVNGHSKGEYFGPAMLTLFGAGSIQWERWLQNRKPIGYSYSFVIMITGVMLLPFAMDILPVNQFVPYSQALGIGPKSNEGHEMKSLPQHYADRFGWKEFASDVAKAFKTLSPDEQKYTAIYVHNYGEAGAIDFYGAQYGLPKAFAGQNSYWLWGKERIEDSVSVLIAVGGEAHDYSDTFEVIEQVGIHSHSLAMIYENNLPIFICRKPKLKLKDVWHTTRFYI